MSEAMPSSPAGRRSQLRIVLDWLWYLPLGALFAFLSLTLVARLFTLGRHTRLWGQVLLLDDAQLPWLTQAVLTCGWQVGSHWFAFPLLLALGTLVPLSGFIVLRESGHRVAAMALLVSVLFLWLAVNTGHDLAVTLPQIEWLDNQGQRYGQ